MKNVDNNKKIFAHRPSPPNSCGVAKKAEKQTIRRDDSARRQIRHRLSEVCRNEQNLACLMKTPLPFLFFPSCAAAAYDVVGTVPREPLNLRIRYTYTMPPKRTKSGSGRDAKENGSKNSASAVTHTTPSAPNTDAPAPTPSKVWKHDDYADDIRRRLKKANEEVQVWI